jgi:uncharacterized protein (DUF488 family)
LTVFTVGHSNRSADALIRVLLDAGVTLLVDVRSYPGSRRWPQFNREMLAPALAAQGIAYHHEPRLGGRRSEGGAASPNGAWQEPAFRRYADYAMTPPFRNGVRALMAQAETNSIAIMCAEANWWQCHRRIITDYLVMDGLPVCHLTPDGQRLAAVVTPGAVRGPDGAIVYPPIQATLL